MKLKVAAVGIGAIMLAGCGALPGQVSRADAVEACELAFRFFDTIPHPRAGQPRTTLSGQPMRGVFPSRTAPDAQTLSSRYVAIRVAVVRSGDRDLEAKVGRMEDAAEMFTGWRSLPNPTAEVISDRTRRAGEMAVEFLAVCREKEYA